LKLGFIQFTGWGIGLGKDLVFESSGSKLIKRDIFILIRSRGRVNLLRSGSGNIVEDIGRKGGRKDCVNRFLERVESVN
jgi:hypothetical protein